LSGAIPTTVQTHNWRTLDLSFNRLSGSLQGDFGANLGETTEIVDGVVVRSDSNTVHLQNNRLSGRIPSALVHLLNVSMLGSNMFSCNAARTDLPHYDGDRDRYECSSESFNSQFYAALILAFVLAVLWVCRQWWPAAMKSTLLRVEQRLHEVKINEDTLTPRLRVLLVISEILCKVAVVSAALTLVSLGPWYAIAHSYFSTYTHTYAWVISAAFLSGLTPTVTGLTLYCTLMTAVILGAAVLVRKTDDAARQRSRTASSTSIILSVPATAAPTVLAWQRTCAYAVFLVINMTVVLGVNVGFVAITLSASTSVVTLAQLLLSLFKLVWNMACTPYMIDLVTAANLQAHISPTMITMHVFLSLVNNVVIPCLVIAAQSPSCFNEWFSSTPSVAAVYTIPGCFLQYQDSTFNYTTVCSYKSPVELVTDFNPLFRYEYQCSSSFITYYAPAFVYLGIVAGMGVPLGKAAALWLLERAVPGTRWHWLLNILVPRILKPIAPATAHSERDENASARLPTGRFAATRVAFTRIRKERLLDANSLINTLVTYLGILLTFGVVFPPLAALMCATMLSVAWQTRVIIGRALHSAQAAGSLHVLKALERDCRVVLSVTSLRRVLFIIVCICCSFYALFLFDTLGDAEGLSRAYWVLIVMPSFPIVLYVINCVHRRCAGRGEKESASFFLDQSAVELSAMDDTGTSSGEASSIVASKGDVEAAESVSNVILSAAPVNALEEP
jgi:hypothetical protein